ncbi:MFS general substrate transporter [Rhizoclosmatium globosum]|uniref:MFS general substrate transporter n=1 Tax=Rhizoclosmatium globosum TaxID=329046 RepID=A0A1Y2BTZ0_9FUNG|nr:MFS general substrate transporter [Rhizoclosmatium globosum]|eukprot:ORY38203.1 MFS general substrate transporter [Rhizoclosmatium globosum]
MEDPVERFQVYPQRFLVLFAVFCANFNNAIVWSTYAAVTPSTAERYGVSTWEINQLVLFFDMSFFPLCGVALWVLDVKGLKPSVLTGVWITICGAFLRWTAKYYYDPLELITVGSVMAALVNPFTLDAPTKVAITWFAENERLTATTIMSLATYMGPAFVLTIAPLIVDGNPNNVDTLNWITFLVILVLGIPSLLLQNEPPSPPSKVANQSSVPFWDGVKQLTRNRQFILLFWVAGISMGCFEVYITLISDTVVPYGYSETDAGTVGVISILSGILSSLVIARMLDHSKAHRIVLKILPFVTVVGAVGFFFSAHCADRRVFLYFSASIIGVGCFPVLPIALEVGSECARPVAAGTSGGMIETSIEFCAIFILLVSNLLRQEGDKLGYALVWFIGLWYLLRSHYFWVTPRS